ncbi:hypothetical protein GGQ68_000731 [Sagittula marina]|uniref:DUF3987 domain-containing protein n=1 Tax=Sagittula marina TaxID=943940 RepID=A0A7W6DJI2_9RHOB|nr:YfjI family protein [Sagittula marina]MBB3984415.1 hypothetical protein [Sagittula marina]
MNTPQPIPFAPEGPQPLVREIASGAAYPVDHLGPLRAAVEAVQARTQAPVAIPAASALTVASLAVQGFADVETLGGARPLSLFALTIARSGERKSSCDAPLMAALRDHEREQSRARADAVTCWQNTHALWKGERDRILGKIRNGGSEIRTAAQADLKALGGEPSAPLSQDRTVTEPTFEGLTKLFAEGQPSLGIFSDEGGQFLGGHAMNRDNRTKTLAAFNDLWQGNPIRRTRAGDGHAVFFGRRLAVHLMVQPSVAYDFLADAMTVDTGFLPRFLVCEPPSTIGTRLYREVDMACQAIGQFECRLRKILNAPMPLMDDNQSLDPRGLKLSMEAKFRLIEFANEVEVAQAPGRDFDSISGYASKAAEQAARISGVLTLWSHLDAKEVSATTMVHGIELARYYLSEALRLTAAARVSPQIRKAEKLRKWLIEECEYDHVTVRDMMRFGPSGMRERPQIKESAGVLEQHGWLIRLPEGTTIRGSARKECWRICRSG